MIDMSLTKIRLCLDNAHDNYAFIQAGTSDENCYIQLKGIHDVAHLYVDAFGRVYNEHSKPYLGTSRERNTRIAVLQCKIDELQKELDCIRRGD